MMVVTAGPMNGLSFPSIFLSFDRWGPDADSDPLGVQTCPDAAFSLNGSLPCPGRGHTPTPCTFFLPIRSDLFHHTSP